jgi:hypothetical protein
MNVSGVNGAAAVVVTAPGPTDRAPSEAARDAAMTKGSQSTAEKATDQAAEQAARRAAEKARQERPPERVAPLEGLSMPEMLTLLGMRPVSPAEAARQEAPRASAGRSFDTYV